MEFDLKQQEAIQKESSQYTVVASAGAGKTRVLVGKYLHLVEKGYSPTEILTITFTVKAAAEMKHRIVESLGKLGLIKEAQMAESGPIQTIDSFCEQFLRENSLAAKIDPQVQIVDEAEQRTLTKRFIQDVLSSDITHKEHVSTLLDHFAGKGSQADGVENWLAEAINSALTHMRQSIHPIGHFEEIYSSVGNLIEALGEMADNEEEAAQMKGEVFNSPPAMAGLKQSLALGQLTVAVWEKYEAELRRLGKCDFNMLEKDVVALLKTNHMVAERAQEKFKHLLIDESQDLNPIQYELLRALGIRNELYVGDIKQSIYGFRQSNPKLFKDLSCGESVSLEINYRTHPDLLASLNEIFLRLLGQGYEPMAPNPNYDRNVKPELAVIQTDRYRHVSDTCDYIESIVEKCAPSNEIAVICHSNSICSEFSTELKSRGIPCHLLGESEQFHSRMEVRDLCNALQLCADLENDFAAAAVLLSPFVRLSLDGLVILSQTPGIITNAQIRIEELAIEDQAKINGLLEWLLPIHHLADRVPAWEVVSDLLHRTPFLAELAQGYDPEQTIANVRKILAMACGRQEMDTVQFSQHLSSHEFQRSKVSEASLLDRNSEGIKILTIHGAKGLEFDTVILPSLFRRWTPNPEYRIDVETGLAVVRPSGKASKGGNLYYRAVLQREKQQIDAEFLRVLYVAMTRARMRLVVACYKDAENSTSTENLFNEVAQRLKAQGRLSIVDLTQQPVESSP